MKYVAGAIVLALLAFLPLHYFFTSNQGFNAAISAVEEQYHSSPPQTVPLQWLASLCATASTGGGVRHLRIANFHHIHGLANPDNLATLLSSRLSKHWQRIILNREGAQQINIIYVRPEGRAMRMLIANYDHGELDLVRMDVNGERLAHFVQDPAHTASHNNTIPD